MKYNVIVFTKTGRLEENTNREAESMTAAAQNWPEHNKIVRTSKTSRFFHKTKALMYRAKVYKISFDDGYYVMVLVKNIPFMFRFSKKDQRNEAFKCAQESAKIAGVGQQQTAIIASLEGAKDMKSTSTLLKTLSKSVGSATKVASSTGSHIGSSFGSDDANNSAKSEWPSGYRDYPLKFTAQVAYLPEYSSYPGTNSEMQKLLFRKTVFVVRKQKGYGCAMYHGAGWTWKARWLKQVPAETKFFQHNGKTKEFAKVSPGFWMAEDGKPVHESLLSKTFMVKVKNGIRSNERCNVTLAMEQLMGENIRVTHKDDRYFGVGHYWLHEWLELPDEQPEPKDANSEVSPWTTQKLGYDFALTNEIFEKMKQSSTNAGSAS